MTPFLTFEFCKIYAFKHNKNKAYVMIGFEILKHVCGTKYLGFTLCESKTRMPSTCAGRSYPWAINVVEFCVGLVGDVSITLFNCYCIFLSGSYVFT